jgi:hypothetical protein
MGDGAALGFSILLKERERFRRRNRSAGRDGKRRKNLGAAEHNLGCVCQIVKRIIQDLQEK